LAGLAVGGEAVGAGRALGGLVRRVSVSGAGRACGAALAEGSGGTGLTFVVDERRAIRAVGLGSHTAALAEVVGRARLARALTRLILVRSLGTRCVVGLSFAGTRRAGRGRRRLSVARAGTVVTLRRLGGLGVARATTEPSGQSGDGSRHAGLVAVVSGIGRLGLRVACTGTVVSDGGDGRTLAADVPAEPTGGGRSGSSVAGAAAEGAEGGKELVDGADGRVVAC
jgi:hypothetical protein